MDQLVHVVLLYFIFICSMMLCYHYSQVQIRPSHTANLDYRTRLKKTVATEGCAMYRTTHTVSGTVCDS
jgi:hypothetical protein